MLYYSILRRLTCTLLQSSANQAAAVGTNATTTGINAINAAAIASSTASTVLSTITIGNSIGVLQMPKSYGIMIALHKDPI